MTLWRYLWTDSQNYFFVVLQIKVPLRTYQFYHSMTFSLWDMTSFITSPHSSWIYVWRHTLCDTVTSVITRFPKFFFCCATNNNTFTAMSLVLLYRFYFLRSKDDPARPLPLMLISSLTLHFTVTSFFLPISKIMFLLS